MTFMHYSYDTEGTLVSVNYNGTEYYYLRNGQNDVVGLVDGSGSTVVEYRYDAWGKLLSTTGALASTLGNDNPIRYRGYYYDAETGLYYLQSRYYDPDTGRFINSDDVAFLGATGTALSCNLFAYCENNPVNDSDESGHSWLLDVVKKIKAALYKLKQGGNKVWNYVCNAGIYAWTQITKTGSQLWKVFKSLGSSALKALKNFGKWLKSNWRIVVDWIAAVGGVIIGIIGCIGLFVQLPFILVASVTVLGLAASLWGLGRLAKLW